MICYSKLSSISIKGSSMISFFIDFLWIDNKIAGNKIMFVNMDINKVIDINTPNATVPPKLEAENIEKPQNKIIEV